MELIVYYESESESHLVVTDSLRTRGIRQARKVERVALPFSKGSSQPRDSLPAEPQGKHMNTGVGSLSLLQQIFPTQELNWDVLHCGQIFHQLSYQGSS